MTTMTTAEIEAAEREAERVESNRERRRPTSGREARAEAMQRAMATGNWDAVADLAMVGWTLY